MKTIKLMLTVSLLSISFNVLAAPSETECQITSTIDSPLIGFLKVPLLLSNPLYSIGFVASSYRNSQCPRPELITKDQAQLMIQEAIQQFVVNSQQSNKVLAMNSKKCYNKDVIVNHVIDSEFYESIESHEYCD